MDMFEFGKKVEYDAWYLYHAWTNYYGLGVNIIGPYFEKNIAEEVQKVPQHLVKFSEDDNKGRGNNLSLATGMDVRNWFWRESHSHDIIINLFSPENVRICGGD